MAELRTKRNNGAQAGFLLANFAGYVISGVPDAGFAHYSVARPAYWPLVALYGSAAAATSLVPHRRRKEVRRQSRTRLRRMMAGMGILITFATRDISPIFTLDHHPFSRVRIPPRLLCV